ncbi:MAG: chloride channel protein [Bryobacteraceae bacterium]
MIRKLVTMAQRVRLGEAQRFMLLSMLIGIFGGLVVVCFHGCIELMTWSILGVPAGENKIATVLGPGLGALIATMLAMKVFKGAQGSGVNRTKAALYISDGDIPFRTVVGKFVACTISLGSGNSLGPEDPALQMGSGVASALGRIFQLTKEQMRLIAPIGAAAGIAAAFNTPIMAVLFVIEEVIAAWNSAVLGSIVLSSVAAVVVSRSFLGDEPLFRVPDFAFRHTSELLVYAGIGFACGLLASLFVRNVVRIKQRFKELPHTLRLDAGKPLLAGVLVGLVGLMLPETLGVGYEAVDGAIHNRFPWHMLLVFGVAKLVATTICYTAGIPGGLFAPTLFIGAMVGGGIGGLAQQYWPLHTSPATGYVLVGMGAFFAGVFRAPMTSIFMVFEVSASYKAILPVMVANTIAYLTSRQLYRRAFFDQLAKLEGLELPSHEAQREQRTLRVEDAMSIEPDVELTPETTIAYAREVAGKTQGEWFLSHDSVREWRLIAKKDLAPDAVNRRVRLGELDGIEVPHIFPDQALHATLRRLGSAPILPVVSRENAAKLLGVMDLRRAMDAYGVDLDKVAADGHEPEPAPETSDPVQS